MLLQLGKGVTHKKILFIGAACFILLACLNLPGIYNILVERVTSAVDLSYASNRARLLRWGQAFVMFAESPILGKGYGAFAMLYEEDVALVGSYTAQYQLGAHSEYLQVMAELGIVGLGIWVWLNFAFLRYGFRALQTLEDGFYRRYGHWINGGRNFIDGAFHSKQSAERGRHWGFPSGVSTDYCPLLCKWRTAKKPHPKLKMVYNSNQNQDFL